MAFVTNISGKIKVQMKCFFIAEFGRAAKITKITILPFLNVASSSRVITV